MVNLGFINSWEYEIGKNGVKNRVFRLPIVRMVANTSSKIQLEASFFSFFYFIYRTYSLKFWSPLNFGTGWTKIKGVTKLKGVIVLRGPKFKGVRYEML